MTLQPIALYLHVPFCRSICPYCDFAVYAGSAASGPRSQVAALVDALGAEIALRAEAFDTVDALLGTAAPRQPLRSVYLGGGTPSLLEAGAVSKLLEQVDHAFGIAPDAEVTLEANPGVADRTDLPGFRAAGVTRLSIGAQSLVTAELRTLGRRHDPEDVAETVRLAREAGFSSISLDLLYDVPGQTMTSWRQTLERAIELEPHHVSTYALTLELEGIHSGDHVAASSGALRWRRRAAAAQDEDRAADMDALADELLEVARLRRYEIANRARPGHESRHNLVYWKWQPYEAVGPGAHAFDGVAVRRWNDADLAGYLGALRPDSGVPRLPPGGAETLDPATASAERLMLALRLSQGIDAVALTDPAFAEPLGWGMEVGVLEVRDLRLRLTPRGRLLSNELFARLLPLEAAA